MYVLSNFLSGFKQRVSKKLECLGDAAVDAKQYNEAISKYSAALSFDLAISQGLLIKRSKAYETLGLWEDALKDANEVRSFLSRVLLCGRCHH